ncbi:MAG TPA: hypothetical protein VFP02_05900 [Acidimicrobiales bacterium]|nr:hypothetical protein [Acidimicrobiales bacterium]
MSGPATNLTAFVARLPGIVPRVISGAVARTDKAWDGIGARLPTRGLPGEALLVAVVVGYAMVNVARSTLDTGIQKIHAVGVSGVSANSLHDGRDAIDTAFMTWNDGDERLSALVRFHPVTLARAQTVLELLLVPLTLVLFYGLLKWLRGRVGTGPRSPARAAVLTLLEVAAIGVLGYVVLGLFNQLAELAILANGDSGGPFPAVLALTGPVRGLLLPLFLVPVAVALLQMHRDRTSGTGPPPEPVWRGAPTAYRVLFVVVILHAVLVLASIPGEQTADALRLWLTNPLLGVTGLVFTALFCVALAAIALRIGTDANPKRVVLARAGTARLIGIGFALAAVGGVARYGFDQAWGAGVLAAGILVLLAGLLSFPLAPAAAGDPPTTATTAASLEVVEPVTSVKRLVPALLVVAPFTVLAVSLVRAAIPTILDESSSGWLAGIAVITGACAVIGWCFARLAARWAFKADTATRRRVFRATAWALTAIIAAAYVAVVFDDAQRWSRDLGVVAIIAVFLTAVVLVFGTLGYVMESRALPAVLDFVNFRRLPVILSLVALALLSNQFALPGYHDFQRLDDVALPAESQITAEEAFEQWTAANLTDAQETDEPGDEQAATPMVFVAAAGGGIKAAAFTASTIDCLFQDHDNPNEGHPCNDTDAYNRLFAASGASGGSVGIASVVAERADGQVGEDWVQDRLGNDLLSPELAWQVMVEVPNAIARFQPGQDRGEVLTDSWTAEFADDEHDPGAEPFYVDQTDDDWSGPQVFFSGTNLNDGCRVNISGVRSAQADGSPEDQQLLAAEATRSGACNAQRADDGRAPDQAGTRDLVDYLCGQNVDLATAAFLSARFPFVSPTGTTRCPDDDAGTSDSLSIGDGGYRDNSGAGSLMDSWAALDPLVAEFNASHDQCVVPIFVEINTGYSGFGGPSAAGDVAQIIAPPLGAARVFSDLSYGPIEQAAAEFSRPLAPDRQVLVNDEELPTRFFRVTLVDHPGVTAALGWSLSERAVDDLVGQLDLTENRQALDGLRDLLDPSRADTLRCA